MGLVISPSVKIFKLWIPLTLLNFSCLCLNSWYTIINFDWGNLAMAIGGLAGTSACVIALLIIRKERTLERNP